MRSSVLHSINVSTGGVPKAPRPAAGVSQAGVEGDRQRALRFHGGPARAVCVYSLDLIEALRAEGHPIAIGTAGENLTLAGIDWSSVKPGAVIDVGDVTLEVTTPAFPCKNIAPSFSHQDFTRISEKLHPGWSRWYCRVLREGHVVVGDRVGVISPDARPRAGDAGDAGGVSRPA